MSYPKAMLSQLTDLDDSELDEQAGVFSFSKKSAPPSPKVFFNPTSVFLDVPDYRETVSHSKRFTHQPSVSTNNFTGNNTLPLSATSSHTLDCDNKPEDNISQNKVSKLLKSQRTSSRNSERSMSVETFKHKKDPPNSKTSRSRLPYFETSSKLEESDAPDTTDREGQSTNSNTKPSQQPDSDSESVEDSDEQEEYLYKPDTRRDNNNQRGYPLTRNKSWVHEGYANPHRNQNQNQTQYDDKPGYGKPNQRRPKARQYNFPHQTETRSEYYPSTMNVRDNPDFGYNKAMRKSRQKFSSDGRDPNPSLPYEQYVYQSHRQTYSQDPNRNSRPPFKRRTYVDWDSEDELLPLWNMSRGMREIRPRRTGLRAISFMPILLIITIVSFTFAIFSLSGLPLVEVGIVGFENVLASPKELAFDLLVHGSNLNIWSVPIHDVDLLLYATPIPPPPDNSTVIFNATDPPTPVFLGKIWNLEQNLEFPGRGFWSSKGPPITLTSLLILKNPGDDNKSGNSSQWSDILKGTYDLTVRGDLSYKIFLTQSKVPVCASQRIEPAKAAFSFTSPSSVISCIAEDV